MIISSNFKINLGLNVLRRREDGFSDIETVMYAVRSSGLCDIVEVVESGEFAFTSSGIKVDCNEEDNLCVKAYRLLKERYGLPSVHIHLHKRVPFGAGLGAGSANAVAVMKLCREIFALDITDSEMESLAAELGSDTAFFVRECPVVARGRGELLEAIDLDLAGYYLLLVKPEVGVSTREAYAGVVPHTPKLLPSKAITLPIEHWQGSLVNDFEDSIFRKLPLLREIKQRMLTSGALYASMSGSGSTIYGIFSTPPHLTFPHFTQLIELIHNS